MDGPREIDDEQAKRWNGPAAQAWIDAQDVVDRLFKPLETLLVEAVSDRVLALNYGRPLATGTPQEVQSHPEVIRAYFGG